MISVGGRKIVNAITYFVNQTIHEENIPEYQKDSSILNFYKEKDDVTNCRNYRALTFLDHAMKVSEPALESLICSQVAINSIHFAFEAGCINTEAIYILLQMQQTHFIRKKIHHTFIDFEKAFDLVAWSILWWDMRKMEIDE